MNLDRPGVPRKLRQATAGRPFIEGKRIKDSQLDFHSMWSKQDRANKKIAEAAEEHHQVQQQMRKLERDFLHTDRKPVTWSGGWVMLPKELLMATDLTDSEKQTWMMIFSFAMDKKHAWPSVERIANLKQKSKRQVQRDLTTLVRRGYITIKRMRHNQTNQLINTYHFNIEEVTRK